MIQIEKKKDRGNNKRQDAEKKEKNNANKKTCRENTDKKEYAKRTIKDGMQKEIKKYIYLTNLTAMNQLNLKRNEGNITNVRSKKKKERKKNSDTFLSMQLFLPRNLWLLMIGLKKKMGRNMFFLCYGNEHNLLSCFFPFSFNKS